MPLNKMACVSRDGCCSCGKSSVESDGRVVGVATLELEELSMWGMVVGRRGCAGSQMPSRCLVWAEQL